MEYRLQSSYIISILSRSPIYTILLGERTAANPFYAFICGKEDKWVRRPPRPLMSIL